MCMSCMVLRTEIRAYIWHIGRTEHSSVAPELVDLTDLRVVYSWHLPYRAHLSGSRAGRPDRPQSCVLLTLAVQSPSQWLQSWKTWQTSELCTLALFTADVLVITKEQIWLSSQNSSKILCGENWNRQKKFFQSKVTDWE